MNNKTTVPNKDNFEQGWHFIDAKGKVLGRFAVEVATILTGKDKALFTRNINVGDKVVITNADKITVTGKKLTDKEYVWYTGFPSGLRSIALRDRLAKDPTRALRDAISGMLPHNKLRKERLANLYVYAGTEHPHTAHDL